MDPDDAYANMPHIPDGAAYPARWQDAAAAFRTHAPGRLDIRHGPAPRAVHDLFLPPGAPRGTLVFVHGGFWRAFDKSLWSHLAAGPLARGWAVAMPSYTLCPRARIAEITAETAGFLGHLAGAMPGPLRLAGHSAGGHLVARMVNADVLPDPLSRRIERVVPISPLSDLGPLIGTTMNDDLAIDAALAEAESPRRHARIAVTVSVIVGGAERPAFLDQARWLAEAWGCDLAVYPGRHHFDVIEGLCHPDSDLVRAILD